MRIEKLAKEKTSLQEQLSALEDRQEAARRDLVVLGEKKISLERENMDKMYQWLTVHQNLHSGLIMSFEGDREVADWGFTYDQALTAQVYTNFSDFARARKILDFFCDKAQKQDGLFFNAYYVDGMEPAEFMVHAGPNIWLGIAALRYAVKTNDKKYLGLAEEIARGIIALQQQDKEGGIVGGPQVNWFSTEHNLDAYAFFTMLTQVTSRSLYRDAAEKTLHWLITHTYDKEGIPVKRGKGDSTIATDTYAWSIAALGPAKLEEIGMSPDKIMDFAEDNCLVEVNFVRPDGETVQVKGFDFALQAHTARGGVVSSEWTSQMVVSFKIMAEYYAKLGDSQRSQKYARKANEYLNELSKMIISSPSPSGQGQGCLPYATLDFVDTGHGWTTPKGRSTGSVSGTAYMLFAYYGYNPLELKE